MSDLQALAEKVIATPVAGRLVIAAHCVKMGKLDVAEMIVRSAYDDLVAARLGLKPLLVAVPEPKAQP